MSRYPFFAMSRWVLFLNILAICFLVGWGMFLKWALNTYGIGAPWIIFAGIIGLGAVFRWRYGYWPGDGATVINDDPIRPRRRDTP